MPDPDAPQPPGTPPQPARPMAVRAVIGFGRFWWEFLIGDTPELFVGAAAVLGLVALACLDHAVRTAAAVALPALVACLLGVSLWRATHRRAG